MFPFWLLPSLIGLFAVAVTIYVEIYVEITSDTIKDTVREKDPEAFKIKINEAKKNAVNVGIFDRQNKHLEDMKIESSEGVSSSVKKGQVIYM